MLPDTFLSLNVMQVLEVPLLIFNNIALFNFITHQHASYVKSNLKVIFDLSYTKLQDANYPPNCNVMENILLYFGSQTWYQICIGQWNISAMLKCAQNIVKGVLHIYIYYIDAPFDRSKQQKRPPSVNLSSFTIAGLWHLRIHWLLW